MYGNPMNINSYCVESSVIIILVPEVFLEPRERCEAVNKSREAARREKPLVTLDLNLTFMQTPAVKRVKLIITKGT